MNCRYLICVPVYNNPQTVGGVVQECLSITEFPILVMDDGSTTPVQSLIASNPRISHERFPENQGKGVVLKEAFRWAAEKGFTHLITIDADGQHRPQDISKLVNEANAHPRALIVGDRDMDTENVPGTSSFGKKFSNFWVKYQTDTQVGDSQSGFRIYPIFWVQTMSFFRKRYDFEIEVLIRLIWKGVEVRNVKIAVTYFPPETRVSHFDKFWDNVHISVLNTVLTTVALFRDQRSPLRNSTALALGVAVGCTPLFGLHTGLVIVLSLLFRLNVVYMWVGTNISIPPLIPFLALGSSYLGEKILGETPDGAFAFSKAWLVGSIGLGTILGSVTFLLCLLGWTLKSRTQSQKNQKRPWTGKSQNRVGVEIIRIMMKTLGRRFAYFFLHFVVTYYVIFSRRARKAFTEYWKVIEPGLGFWTRQKQMYLQILCFAQTLVDRAFQRQSQLMAFHINVDPSSKAVLNGDIGKSATGTVLVATHFGGWDMALAILAKSQIQAQMTAVMFSYNNQPKQTSEAGDVVHFNLEQDALMKLRHRLSRGGLVGMMADRPVGRSFELISFFKKIVALDSTAIRLALACQSDIYYVFAAKEDFDNYRLFVHKYEVDQSLSSADQIQRFLKQYSAQMEMMVRRYPHQWFNFFPFWSEPPT